MAIDNTIGIARHISYKVLCDVHMKGAYSNLSIQKHFLVLKKPEDKALATAIIFGTLKRNIQLTRAIEKLSSIAYDRIKPEITVIIKSALFQLFYMDKLPAYAVVNDSVNLAKFYISKKSGAFVNAVLRSALRMGKQALIEGSDTGSFCAELEKKYDIPCWLCDYLKDEFSEEFLKKWGEAYQRSPKMYIRANLLKIQAKEAFAELNQQKNVCKETVLPDVFEVTDAGEILVSKLFLEDKIAIQDMSSALCAYVLDAKAQDTVLDLCAAPGGKSLHIASLTAGKSVVTASDKHKHKVDRMKTQFRMQGIDNIQVCKNNAEVFRPAWEEAFDCVLADVPCSGLGVIHRKPEILLHLDESKISDLIAVQKNILYNAAKYVKSKGTLVYSTCSINPLENERVITAFLAKHKNFTLSEISLPVAITKKEGKIFPGEINKYPQDSLGDGFYICKMKKK